MVRILFYDMALSGGHFLKKVDKVTRWRPYKTFFVTLIMEGGHLCPTKVEYNLWWRPYKLFFLNVDEAIRRGIINGRTMQR